MLGFDGCKGVCRRRRRLAHPHIAKGRKNVPVELMSPCRQGGPTEAGALSLGKPSFGERRKAELRRELLTAAAVHPIPYRGGEAPFGECPGAAVHLNLAGDPVIVPVGGAGPSSGLGAVGSDPA
jgi:hypothetical protein